MKYPKILIRIKLNFDRFDYNSLTIILDDCYVGIFSIIIAFALEIINCESQNVLFVSISSILLKRL